MTSIKRLKNQSGRLKVKVKEVQVGKMVVNTHKFAHKKFYEPQSIIERGKANKYAASHSKLVMLPNACFKAANYLPSHIKTRADFIIADTSKRSFIKGVVPARLKISYVRMPVAVVDKYIPPLETEVKQSRMLVYEDVHTLPELTKVARPIGIVYLNQALIETLLGSQGKCVLEKVLSLINGSVAQLDWPLERVEVRYIRDPEVKSWEYILLLLVFTCDFDTADRHLHELYDQIDALSSKLSDEEQEVLRRMIFFDIETKASISST